MPTLLTCQSLSKSYSSKTLFQGVALGIEEGERLGLIGPNGSGKSTLLKILAGFEPPDTGQITRRKGLRIGYVAQNDNFPPEATALSLVESAIDQLHEPHERHLHAELTLRKIGFQNPDQPAGQMSGGWRKRLAIAVQVARQVDLLLMDEPTNHLDVAGIWWLENLLEESDAASVVVTHDRYFLEESCSRVLELSRAYPEGTFTVDGPYSAFLRRRAEFLTAQRNEQQSLANQVRKDIEWLRRGAKARRTKAKGRIDASFERMDELADLKERNAPARAAGIDFAATGRKTHKLIEAKGLGKTLGDRKLFSHLDLTLSPGTRVGLIGTNGSGKTTLIGVLTGQTPPDTGAIKRADNLRIVTFTQQRQELDRGQSLKEALSPIGDTFFHLGRPTHVAAWAQRFLFRTEQFNTAVGDLSGGEQARILIARLMLHPADVLILDEPTNDLDIASLEVLEESVEEFPGAVLLVTHDRFMMERLATEILALDGRGSQRSFASYHQWQSWWEQVEADRAAESHPVAKPQAVEIHSTEAPVRKKLSYKEQRELDQMEANILAAEQAAKEIEAKLADPAVASDHKKTPRLYADLGAAHDKVRALYDRWAELEAKIS
jgi:ATP-binding cassette subfamily F protein uup